jgi:serine/threonine protein kinase
MGSAIRAECATRSANSADPTQSPSPATGSGANWAGAPRAWYTGRRPVALKTVAPAAGAGRRQIRRFVRESKILGRLDHPNIVAFQEVGESAGVIYLVKGLVDGPDLGSRPSRRSRAGGPRSPSDAAGVSEECQY